MKSLIIFFMMFTAAIVNAQDTYMQKTSLKQDSIAKNLTATYTDKLALSGKQQLLFQKKVEQFLIEKQKIENDMSGKVKLDALYKIGQEENAEMRDVLTQEQYDLYVRIKPSIQPLEKVNLKDN